MAYALPMLVPGHVLHIGCKTHSTTSQEDLYVPVGTAVRCCICGEPVSLKGETRWS